MEEITKKVVDGKVADTIHKVDTDGFFDQVGTGLHQTQGNVHPINMNNPQNVNLTEANAKNQQEVEGLGNQYFNGMPSTSNPPTIQPRTSVQTKVQESLDKKDAGPKDLVTSAIPDLVKDNVRTGQDYLDPKMRKDY